MEIRNDIGRSLGLDLTRVENKTARSVQRSAEQTVQREEEISISESARELSRLHAQLLAQAADLPEVREDRVEQARARVASGFYSQENVVEKISERIVEEAVPEQSSTGEVSSEARLEYRSDLMQEVAERVRTGYYSDDEVMAFVADRLLDIHDIR